MSNSKFLNPKNDAAFRHTFGSERYKHVLILFINDILGFEGDSKIEDVTFLPTIQDPEIASKKTSIVDVLCKDSKGVEYIIEMQIAQDKGFEKRALYYASKAYMRQLDKGVKEYSSLKEVIFIAITDYIVFPQKAAYKSDHIILDKESHEHDMKDIAFTFIELPKYTKGKSEKLTNRIEQWCRYFKYGDNTTEEEVEKIVDPVVKEAYEAVNRFNWTEEELAVYDAVIKREMDYRSQMQTAEQRGERRGLEKGIGIGREEGLQQGVQQEKLEIARGMIADGEPIEKIIKWTGLSKEAIEKLKLG
jgi:predicted transposase/invertase (TIGR01784 family)